MHSASNALQAEALRRYPALQGHGTFDGLTSAVGAEVTHTRDLLNTKYPVALARLFGSDVLRDLQFFLGTNCVLLCLAGVCLQANVGALRSRMILSAILVTTTLLAAYIYLFLQDWLLTLLFSSYVGATYVAWVAFVAASLLDIAFNKGSVTQSVLCGFAGLF